MKGFFQPADATCGVQHGSKLCRQTSKVSDPNDLIEKIGNTTNQRQKNDDPDPFLLVILPDTMKDTYRLQAEGDIIKIAGNKGQHRSHSQVKGV